MMRTLVAGALSLLLPAIGLAGEYNLTVDRVTIDTGEFVKEGVGYNGTSPGPTLRFNEGEEVSINVTNNLDEMTSIHWHGLILPFEQDGVPGISFPGIKPGETFTYRFPITQSGTYWFHSHSGFQEPEGAFGSIIIEPEGREPFRYDREYVVQLTDKHPHASERVMRNLKITPDYYNRKQQTVGEFFSDVSENGFLSTVKERLAWGDMRMMQADVEDLQGFTGMINGKGPEQNWTGLFEPGERIRLRFINSSAMTYFDIRIPGLKMTVVQADGNNVQPVNVDEFRIGVAETYDVIVRPKDEQAYTIFAESMGRSGYARATLAPEEGMEAPVPGLREPARLTMADMGGMPGMDHGDMGSANKMAEMPDMDHSNMEGMDHSAMMMPEGGASDPFYAKGSGLVPTAANGGKFLSYADLKAQKPLYEEREPAREIELRLTGNMERYTWSINGVKYEDAEPIRLKYGERVRFKFVNETMMTHPMHLHGMWSILDVGAGQWNPIKHTVSVQPGTTVYMETEVDAPGQWAFHCHLTYHMAAGMFRKVIVEGGPESTQAAFSEQPSEIGGDV
ncbi:copper resistance system multicopper oxidase [Marinobacter xiaoshiensis]|uniref:Copper resistance system multicopper oxidase n=1 Tax=Marinobacter xiaoshiensis TaxID=3073652 RepID=A0ABU2HJG2_9GAMM|nr:copper resistance system multicopper oxidase [Marinobacter sp. F60267]MDS1311194.1 copper resistance system multicopper oxidase [Marinobacter sp. F60267]